MIQKVQQRLGKVQRIASPVMGGSEVSFEGLSLWVTFLLGPRRCFYL